MNAPKIAATYYLLECTQASTAQIRGVIMIWNIIPQITTSIALIAFIVAVAAWLIRENMKFTIETIKLIPENERGEASIKLMGKMHIKYKEISNKNAYSLLLKELETRERIARYAMRYAVIMLVAVSIPLTIIAVYSISQNVGDKERQLKKMSDERDKLQDALNQEVVQKDNLSKGIAISFGQAKEMAIINPEIKRLSENLGELLNNFQSRYDSENLSENQNRSIRLIQSTLMNASHKYKEALGVLSTLDEENARIEMQIKRKAYIDTIRQRGISYYGAKNYEKSINQFKKLNQIDSNDITAYHILGNSYFFVDNYELSVSNLKTCVSLLKNSVEKDGHVELVPLLSSSLSNLAGALNLLSKFTDALDQSNEDLRYRVKYSIAFKYDDPVVANSAALSLLSRGNAILGLKFYKDSINVFDSALNYQKSIILYPDDENERANIKNTTAMILNNRGVAYNFMQSYEFAIRDYTEAITIRMVLVENEGHSDFLRDLAVSLNNRGTSYHSSNMYANALKDYNRSIELYERILKYDRKIKVYDELAKSYLLKSYLFITVKRFVTSFSCLLGAINRLSKISPIFAKLFEAGNLFAEKFLTIVQFVYSWSEVPDLLRNARSLTANPVLTKSIDFASSLVNKENNIEVK